MLFAKTVMFNKLNIRWVVTISQESQISSLEYESPTDKLRPRERDFFWLLHLVFLSIWHLALCVYPFVFLTSGGGWPRIQAKYTQSSALALAQVFLS